MKKLKIEDNRTKFKEKVLKDLATKDDYAIIQYFSSCIPWEQIDYFFKEYLTKSDRKKFDEWIEGQTCPIGGVYSWDLIGFFQGRSAMHLY
jgi:hypothetical protein